MGNNLLNPSSTTLIKPKKMMHQNISKLLWSDGFKNVMNTSTDIFFIQILYTDPSRTNPGRREKIKSIFIFTLLCGASKGFMKP